MHTIDAAFHNEFLVLPGDLNARVGMLEGYMVRRHGLDEKNEAGEELLQLCAINELTVINIWF